VCLLCLLCVLCVCVLCVCGVCVCLCVYSVCVCLCVYVCVWCVCGWVVCLCECVVCVCVVCVCVCVFVCVWCVCVCVCVCTFQNPVTVRCVQNSYPIDAEQTPSKEIKQLNLNPHFMLFAIRFPKKCISFFPSVNTMSKEGLVNYTVE